MKGYTSREHADAARTFRQPEPILRSNEYAEQARTLCGNSTNTMHVVFLNTTGVIPCATVTSTANWSVNA